MKTIALCPTMARIIFDLCENAQTEIVNAKAEGYGGLESFAELEAVKDAILAVYSGKELAATVKV